MDYFDYYDWISSFDEEKNERVTSFFYCMSMSYFLNKNKKNTEKCNNIRDD